MKFIGLVVFLTATTSAHSLVIARDLKAIIGVHTVIQTDVDALDNAVKSWTNDPSQALDASNKLIADIKSGTGIVNSSDNLQLIEAIQLLKPVQELTKHAQTLLHDLKGKLGQIQTQGLCQVVRGEINDMNTDGKALIDATVSKVPPVAQDIAKHQAQGIIDVLNGAVDAFSEKNCADA